MGTRQAMENVRYAPESSAAQFKRGDGVLERRRRRAACNRLDLRPMVGQRLLESRPEMLWPNTLEGWHLERGRPRFEERIGRRGLETGHKHLYRE
jgi:hypothetical protein